MYQFNVFLKNRRRELGRSVEGMAGLIKVPAEMIQAWEDGLFKPSLNDLPAIISGYYIECAYLSPNLLETSFFPDFMFSETELEALSNVQFTPEMQELFGLFCLRYFGGEKLPESDLDRYSNLTSDDESCVTQTHYYRERLRRFLSADHLSDETITRLGPYFVIDMRSKLAEMLEHVSFEFLYHYFLTYPRKAPLFAISLLSDDMIKLFIDTHYFKCARMFELLSLIDAQTKPPHENPLSIAYAVSDAALAAEIGLLCRVGFDIEDAPLHILGDISPDLTELMFSISNFRNSVLEYADARLGCFNVDNGLLCELSEMNIISGNCIDGKLVFHDDFLETILDEKHQREIVGEKAPLIVDLRFSKLFQSAYSRGFIELVAINASGSVKTSQSNQHKALSKLLPSLPKDSSLDETLVTLDTCGEYRVRLTATGFEFITWLRELRKRKNGV